MSTFYAAYIRSVVTYTQHLPFFMPFLKNELVRAEKRAMSIICPELPYQKAIELVNLVPIVDFITGLCSNTFIILKDPEHRLSSLIPSGGPSSCALW